MTGHPKNQIKTVSDSRLIADFFREALFHGRTVSAYISGIEHTLHIQDLHEPNSRDRSTKRTLQLYASHLILSNDDRDTDTTFSCAFPKFIVEWKSRLTETAPQSFTSDLPGELIVKNGRLSTRVKPELELGSEVLLQTDTLHCSGVFHLEDYSEGGYGGVLQTTPRMPVVAGTYIYGTLSSQAGSVAIHGQIIQAQLLSEASTDNSRSSYRVGVAKCITSRNSGSDYSSERRRSRRYAVDLTVQVNSPLRPNLPIEMRVKEASIAGFAAEPINLQHALLLPTGVAVSMPDLELKAQLLHADSSTLRFAVCEGSSDARLKWLKRLSRFQIGRVSLTPTLGNQVIDLFCESGAFSSGYLRNHTNKAKDFERQFGTDRSNNSWIHRWIEDGSSGRLSGHASAIKIGDNLWHLGDIAGGSEGAAISREFIPSFLTSFREFCLTCSPCPKILIGWTQGHKYWEKFLSHTDGKGKDSLVAKLATTYTRFSNEPTERSTQKSYEVVRIAASDHKLIRNVRNQCTDEAKSILNAFDFGEDTFGSPRLSESIRASGPGTLKRDYILIEGASTRWIAIINGLPYADSPQRTPEAHWLVPLTGAKAANDSSKEVVSLVRDYSVSNGFSGPGVLTLESQETSSATKRMLWVLAHPQILAFFEGKK